MFGIVCVFSNYEDDKGQEKVFYGMVGSYLFSYFFFLFLLLFFISYEIVFSAFLFISVIFLVLFLTGTFAICFHHSKSPARCQQEFNHQRTTIQKFLNEIILYWQLLHHGTTRYHDRKLPLYNLRCFCGYLNRCNATRKLINPENIVNFLNVVDASEKHF